MTDKIFGFIDDFYLENNHLRISGWMVPTVPKVDLDFFLEIDGKMITIFCYNERQDVADAYNSQSLDFINSGFDVCIPAPKTPNVKIILSYNSTLLTIYELDVNKFYKKLLSDTSIQEYNEIKISNNIFPEIIVVDNFYENPDQVRQIALQQVYEPDLRYFKGKRTTSKFLAPGTKQLFEQLIGKKITVWENHSYNGVFQYCTAEDPLVYHSDIQSFAAAIYLTPDAPVETGTSFFRSKKYPRIRKVHSNDVNYNDVFENDYYDKTKFDEVDTVGNVFNRLVIWDARLIHSASNYFGNNLQNSRLFHLFFFDTE